MELLRLNAEHPDRELVSYIVERIIKGDVFIYPTDTVYGLGCSIEYVDSVKKIFEIKKRDLKIPLSVAFSSLEMAKKYVILNSDSEKFIKKHINDPFTFIVKKRGGVGDIITANKDTVGIRIPNHKVVKELISCAKVPIITTSANISGNNAPVRIEEIDSEIVKNVDLIIDSGPCDIGTPSKIVELSTGRVLRD